VKPVMAKLGPVFKDEAGKVAEMLSKVDASETAKSLEKDGYCMIGGYKISSEQVEICTQKTTVRGRRFIPHVVEPSFGSDRLFYVALEYAYGVKDDRIVMSFPRTISPIQVSVYPLVSKDGLVEKAQDVHKSLANAGFLVEFDEAGSIGRRYARADEAGVPLCITVDYETLQYGTVTIRDRDSWRQVRSQTKDLPDLLARYFLGKINFDNLGVALTK
jgi:glycyl-tRNA synthetase